MPYPLHRMASRLLNRTAFVVALLLCITTGCQSIGKPARLMPSEHVLRREQIVLHSNTSLEAHQRLIDQLCAQRELLSAKLRLPTTDMPIHVYLFDDDNSYYDFLKLRFPGFPPRRAIFVETDAELSIYAYLGEHVAEDLRHEITHGYLHASLPCLPLWLDEGLAEYFEVGAAMQGLNQSHLDYLGGLETFQPNMARLEQLESAAEMTQLDYAESWAWVHFLLESDGDKSQLLTDYLADLQQGANSMLSTQLQKRLAGPELALAEYLQTLQ